ncbi:Pentatricopeptide repeat-containing protein [Acorus calamus]|uniref:Pentatricopeptide repeat-containing protein n=1 Tax=Acorus calamus TaxID=4465 RepID=A0AAV9F145_ACOCL|nr:Pentatricopeptide repeat-containing protein [Acorus calamus]
MKKIRASSGKIAVGVDRNQGRLKLLRPTITSELVLRVLRSCPCNPVESHRFFSWARTHPSYTPSSAEFDELLRTLARSRHWDSMWKLIHHIQTLDLPLSLDTLSFAIHSFGAESVDRAVEIFNRLPKLGCPQTAAAYNSLLSVLCAVHNFHDAHALVRRMRTFSVLVSGWCKAGRLSDAMGFLEEMGQMGFKPPVRGRDLLIDGLIGAGCLESARELVRRMTKEGVLPDVSTLNSLLNAVCDAGEVEFCIGFLQDVERMGFCADLDTYRVMVPAASRCGRVDEAFRLLNKSMEEGHRPFPSLYAPLVKALCKAGRYGDAFGLFADMKERGHPPNRPVYTMLLKMCGRGGKYVEAAEYLMEMIESGLKPRPSCVDAVTEGLRHCGRYDLVQRIQELEVSRSGAI